MITAIVIIAVFFLIVYAFMQQKIFGKNPDAKATEKIKNSANYKDGAFQNLSHTEVNAQRCILSKDDKGVFE
jgi:hypothetical protein